MQVGGGSGSVVLPSGVNINVRRWSGNFVSDSVEELPSFGEVWKNHYLGGTSFTGSVSGKASSGTASKPLQMVTNNSYAAQTANNIGAATLLADSGHTFSGTFLFRNVSMDKDYAAPLLVSADFENGPANSANGGGADLTISSWT